MRILMLHPSLAPRGGAESYLLQLSDSLKDQGHEVRIVTLDDIGRDSLSLRFQGHQESFVKRLLFHAQDLFWPAWTSLIQIIGEYNPDIVHVHNWQRLRLSTFHKISKSWPTVSTVHDFALADPHTTLMRDYSFATKFLLKLRYIFAVKRLQSVTWLVPSQLTKQRILKTSNRVSPTFHVVPLGVRDPLQLSQSGVRFEPVFGFMGALEPHKGIRLILEMMKTRPLQSQFTLLVAGSGSLESEVRSLAASDSRVKFLGSLRGESKREFFRQISWLIFPSLWFENFPIVCCEAVLAGRPVISSGISSTPMVPQGAGITFDESFGAHNLATALDVAMSLSHDQYMSMVNLLGASAEALNFDLHLRSVVDIYRGMM